MNKYELLNDVTMPHEGRTLYRIRAIKDFGDVKKGELGGWVESEDNLSQEGACWVYDEAKVCGSAKVYEWSKITNEVVISKEVHLIGHTYLGGSIIIN